MIDLDAEVLRHINQGHFDELRAENITPELFKFVEGFEKEITLRVQSILTWIEKYVKEGYGYPRQRIIFEEWPWMEDYLDDEETEVSYLAEKLRNRYAKFIQRQHLMALASASPAEFPQLYIEGSRRAFQILSSNNFTVAGEGVHEVVKYQKSRVEDNKTLGVSLGFEQIDEWTGGIRPGHLACLCALPKRQKTWFGDKAWLEQARAGERPVLFTLELSKEEMVGRILCLMGGVSYHRFYRGELLPYEWGRIEESAKEFSTFGGAVVQSPFGNRFVSSIVLDAERHDASSIIIDQFSFLQWSGNHFKENEGYKEIVYDLKNSALTYDIPIYMMAQLNRLEVDDDEFPIAQHIGLTRAVEEASDLLMGIKSNDALKEESQIMVGVMEARHCESGPKARWTIDYDFFNTTKFTIHEI